MLSKVRKNKSGFTLLELLVVVAIIAIIGGFAIGSFDGLEGQASTGAATGSLASIDQTVRTFKVTEGALPSNLESLMSATPGTFTGTGVDAVSDAAGTPAATSMLTTKLTGKFTATDLTDQQLANLIDAGVLRMRYTEALSEVTGPFPLTLATPDAEGGTAIISGPISDIDIPQHAFEAPRPGGAPSGRNRGRGFQFDLPNPARAADGDAATPTALSGTELMVWNSTGYNNIKVGGDADSVLVGFGIGAASDVVGSGKFTNLAHAPYYGKTAKNEYNHYVMLVDVGPATATSASEARLVAMVDSRGDFLDEEFAESTGQKQ